ncbi:uncharacterized protein LOC113303988 [Papaver somniferum]|uniref:uncharacterized protein LOC113303988 n=1 Tax=Papaver somniferum TaxID=3469 RepID=UPI000E6F7853|nr:uncharacterized protein LOC113303988 [Papaver somniferum]
MYDSQIFSPLSEPSSDRWYIGHTGPKHVLEFFDSLSDHNLVLNSNPETDPNLVLNGELFISCYSASSFHDVVASPSILGKRSFSNSNNSPSFSPIKNPCYELGDGSSSKISVSWTTLRRAPFSLLDLTHNPDPLFTPKPSFYILVEDLGSEKSSNDSNSPHPSPLAIDQYGSNIKGDEEKSLDNWKKESINTIAKNQSTTKRAKESMGGANHGN